MVEEKLILTIDDEVDVTEMIAMMLHVEGYRVEQAHSVFAAMRALGDEIPALVLLDMMMPGVDGMQFCATLRDNPATAEIPVVFVTALSGEMDRARAADAGAAGYLAKPFTLQALTEEISRILAE